MLLLLLLISLFLLLVGFIDVFCLFSMLCQFVVPIFLVFVCLSNVDVIVGVIVIAVSVFNLFIQLFVCLYVVVVELLLSLCCYVVIVGDGGVWVILLLLLGSM